MRLPDRLFCGLWREENDTLPLVQDEPLDEHQTHECLPETNSIAQEAAAVLACDLHERPIRLFLIAVELREHLRAGLFPLAGRHLMAAKELVQRLRVDIKRRVGLDLALNDAQNVCGYVLCLGPVFFVPFLKHGHGSPRDLDVQFYVFGQTWKREIG